MTTTVVRTSREESARDAGRFGARAALGLLALLVGAVPFLALMLAVRREWTPLLDVDDGVADGLNAHVSRSPALVDALQVVTELGGNVFAVYVFLLTTAWFAVRRQRRLAWYVATTGIGLAVLVPVTKVLIGRDRPAVPSPITEMPSNASFPSGHAMVAIVTLGMLALVVMPAVRRPWRPLLLPAALVLAVVVGFTRLALGVHFLSDVVAGLALGAGWLAVTTATFTTWQRAHGQHANPVVEGVDPTAMAGQAPASAPPSRPLDARRTVQRLVAAALGIFVLLSAMGLLVTRVLADTALGRLDDRGVRALLDLRTAELTDVMKAVTALSGTPAVIALALATAVLSLAVTASWQPVLFVTATVGGEVLLYFFVTQVVSRARPDVPDLTTGLSTAASWPSGHVAAAVAVYGALAALVVVLGRSPLRWAVVALPVLVAPAVAVTRVYVAAHHPSDVLAGLILGAVWLLVCVRLLLHDGKEQWVPSTTARQRRAPAGTR